MAHVAKQPSVARRRKAMGQMVYVRQGKVDHPARLVEVDHGLGDKVEVQWLSNNTIEFVSRDSLHPYDSARVRRTRKPPAIPCDGTPKPPKVGQLLTPRSNISDDVEALDSQHVEVLEVKTLQ